MRRANVIALRRRPRARPQRRIRRPGPKALLVGAIVLGLGGIALLGALDLKAPGFATSGSGARPVMVTWIDGDSGYIDGREFRLHGVDAPEGSPSRARCTKERDLSRSARAGAENATGGRRMTVARSYGADVYGRDLVDLRADGADVASTLLEAGYVKRWNFERGDSKPDWCG